MHFQGKDERDNLLTVSCIIENFSKKMKRGHENDDKQQNDKTEMDRERNAALNSIAESLAELSAHHRYIVDMAQENAHWLETIEKSLNAIDAQLQEINSTLNLKEERIRLKRQRQQQQEEEQKQREREGQKRHDQRQLEQRQEQEYRRQRRLQREGKERKKQ